MTSLNLLVPNGRKTLIWEMGEWRCEGGVAVSDGVLLQGTNSLSFKRESLKGEILTQMIYFVTESKQCFACLLLNIEKNPNNACKPHTLALCLP